MAAGGREHTDAAERTALAWTRSALAVLAIAGILLKTGLEDGRPALGAASAVALLLLAGLVARAGSPAHPTRRSALALMSAAVVLSAAFSVAMVV